MLVVDSDGRVIYANQAYLKIAGTNGTENLPTVERLLTGASDVSEAIYRLAQAARDQKAAAEEVRLSPPLGAVEGVAWYRVKVRPVERASGRQTTLWSSGRHQP